MFPYFIFQQSWAFVEFEDKEVVQNCIGQEVIIRDCTIKAEPRSNKPKSKKFTNSGRYRPGQPGGRGRPRSKKNGIQMYRNTHPRDALRTRPDVLVDQQTLAAAANVGF